MLFFCHSSVIGNASHILMCISIHSNGYTSIFLYDDKPQCRIHHSIHTIHEHSNKYLSLKKKNTRLISGGKGVISVDRVVINMSSLCLETEIKMPILFLIIYEGAM